MVFSSQSGIGDDHEPGVDDAGDPAEDCQDDVEDEGAGAAFAHEDCEGREEDCDYCFAAADLFWEWNLLENVFVLKKTRLGKTYDHHVCDIDSILSSRFLRVFDLWLDPVE